MGLARSIHEVCDGLFCAVLFPKVVLHTCLPPSIALLSRGLRGLEGTAGTGGGSAERCTDAVAGMAFGGAVDAAGMALGGGAAEA